MVDTILSPARTGCQWRYLPACYPPREAVERPAAECLDLGVKGRADPADLALAERGDPEGFDEVLHPPGADAEDVGLLDDL